MTIYLLFSLFFKKTKDQLNSLPYLSLMTESLGSSLIIYMTFLLFIINVFVIENQVCCSGLCTSTKERQLKGGRRWITFSYSKCLSSPQQRRQ